MKRSYTVNYIETRINEIYQDTDKKYFMYFHPHSDSISYSKIFYDIYGFVPHIIGLSPSYDTYTGTEYKDCRFKYFSTNKTFKKIRDYFDEAGIKYYVLRMDDKPILFTTRGELVYDDHRIGLTYLSENEFLPEDIINCVHVDEIEQEYFYVTRSSQGFDTNRLKVKNYDTDISLNYNDDLPDEKIRKLLNDNNTALIVLHGIPGTGKSTYIRKLIKDVEKPFLYLDQTCFDYLTDASFISLLIQFRDGVIILEDCEHILAERNGSRNNIIAGLLNLTDGILADSFNLKFICTFNAEINRIDKALLRKGRLKLKYEFKELTKDKVKQFFENTESLKDVEVPDKELTLAELFNYNEVNDYSSKQRKTVGF